MNKVIRSLFYKFLNLGSTQIVSFIVGLILARFLSPAEYGTLSLLLVFTNLATIFVQSGLNTALIQKLDADEMDFSTVFWTTMGTATVFYILLYLAASVIADFYDMPNASVYLRVLGFILFPGAINSIQLAKISREMAFQKLFKCNLIGSLASSVIGITMAYTGFGVWALIVQQLTNQTVNCLVMFFIVSWRPRLRFSVSRFKRLFGFGWKLLLSGLLNALYTDLRNLVIGKKYDAETLGLYSRGQQFPSVLISNIDGSINSVMLPALAEMQNNKEEAKSMMRRAVKTSSYIVWPMMIGLAIVAEPTVRLILTDKWVGCVPYLQVLCISYAFMPIHTANLQAINAMGRTDVYLRLEIIKKIYGIAILAIAVFCFESPLAIAVSGVFSGLISTFVNASPNKKIMNYSYFEQIKDIMPSILLSVTMGLIIFPLSWFIDNDILLLVCQILLGVVSYIALSTLFRVEAFRYLWNMAMGMMKGLRPKHQH